MTPRPSRRRWLFPGAALVVLLYTGIGAWLLSRTSPITSAATAPSPLSPSATPTTRADKPLTPTSQHTPTLQPTASLRPSATPITSQGFRLSVVHSNDTWGYTLPCG